MNRLLPLLLALVVTAGCGPSDNAGTDAANAVSPAAEPAAVRTPAPAAAPIVATATTSTPATPAAASDNRIELAQADLSSVAAAGFVEGRHYRRISPTQPTSAGAGKVEVAEFFMYSCSHCYNLEPYVQAWLETKPDYIEFVNIPTTWDEMRLTHAQAFYAAEALGKGEEMHMPFFQAMHVSGNALDTPAKLTEFFGRFDVSADEFESVFDSFAVHTKVNRADELGRRYRIDSTPTLVVNGKYRTGVSEAGGTPEQLFALIEALAATELER